MSRNPRLGHRGKSAKAAKRPLTTEQTLGEEIIEGLTEMRDVLRRGERLGIHFRITERKDPAPEERHGK